MDLEYQEFRELCKNQHNELRKNHGVQSVELANDLNETAQNHAEALAAPDDGCNLCHSDNVGPSCGENLALVFHENGCFPDASIIKNMWYDQIGNYDFYTHDSYGPTGEFTQVVWKDSTEIGVGVAWSNSGKCYLVVNYRPAGNIMGKFEENIFLPYRGVENIRMFRQ